MQNTQEPKKNSNLLEVTTNDHGQRVDNYLLKKLKDVGKSNIYKLIRKGQIRINGKRCKPLAKLVSGDIIRLPPFLVNDSKSVFINDQLLNKIKDSILFDSSDFVVINKPAGLAVHAGTGVSVGLIEVCKKLYANDDIQLAHRLDRDTSGCVVLAKNRVALNRLNMQSKNNTVNKNYLALVKGLIKNDFEVEEPLNINNRVDNERHVIVEEGAKYAKTGFKVSEFYSGRIKATLLQCYLFTGRTHQIRVHTSHINHPIAGDTRYGDAAFNKKIQNAGLTRMFLHASSIEFNDLSDDNIIVSAPLSEELQSVIQHL